MYHVPAVEYAKELIAAGELGEITHYRGYFLADYAADPNGALTWRYKLDGAGLGVLGDIMPHTVDMAQNLIDAVAGLLETVEGAQDFNEDLKSMLVLNFVSSNVFTAPEIATVGCSQRAVDAGLDPSPVVERDYGR